MDKLPCIDCITFPICLSTYRELRLQDVKKEYKFQTISMTLSRVVLKDKCSLLKRYIFNSDNRYGTVMNEFNKIFEHESWRKDDR
jgi:hypothetical protein